MKFVKVPNKRLSLTEEDFTTLVSGNILVKEGVEISLQDIGFRLMKNIIDRQTRENTMTSDELQRAIQMMVGDREDIWGDFGGDGIIPF